MKNTRKSSWVLQNWRKLFLFILTLILLYALFNVWWEPPVDEVVVEIHMESRCPDTETFLRQQLWPVWKDVKEFVELRVVPFGKADCIEKDGDYTCHCQHLEKECELNQLMNCLIDRLHIPDRYLGALVCLQSKDMSAAEGCLKEADLDPQPYIQCAQSPEGRKLHALAGRRTKALEPKMFYVPWILVNGVRVESAEFDFKRTVCERYAGSVKPPVCGTS